MFLILLLNLMGTLIIFFAINLVSFSITHISLIFYHSTTDFVSIKFKSFLTNFLSSLLFDLPSYPMLNLIANTYHSFIKWHYSYQ